MLSGELLNKKSKQWYLREIILLLITYIKLGIPFHHFLQLLQVGAFCRSWGGSRFLLHFKSSHEFLGVFRINF